MILLILMEEVLHHMTCMKPCKYGDIYHINRWRISSIVAFKTLNHPKSKQSKVENSMRRLDDSFGSYLPGYQFQKLFLGPRR